ncbi:MULTISPECIES: TadE/TadG family type IV pilus assembly protein [unclassified Nocardioides]|uniref:TadE/TadG family type IV pilus assembly protein n=1 Tax=unclassified Nocardioides TaxID=2615069 RepID=UPI0009EFB43D|nr:MULTISPECIES: TadE/TadG family type IV pilus assembly protein [unclassified Nocardioides]GAW52568.1 uncharacterized protein PD653B2_4926 [Nocardioides sp. PD653-B2]GAW55593.1 uncharacterized protein PD653_3018 [Nocardioides sp. PD653]
MGRRRDERGYGGAEFILVMAVVVLILFTLIQWSVQLYNDRIVHAAARESAVAAAAWDGTEAIGRQTAQDYLSSSGDDLSDTTITVNVQATQVTVTVSGNVQALVPGMSKRVSATETVPREEFAQ